MNHYSKTVLSILAVVVLAVLFGSSSAVQAAKVDCRIVIPAKCGREVKAAAKDMSLILTKMTGKSYPVVTDEVPMADREIIIGRNKHLEALKLQINWENVGSDGYTIRTAGNKLIIAGGPDRGTLNGVYVFLEEYLGCRWFAPDCTVIPKRKKLEFGNISVERRPVFKWRGLMVTNTAKSPKWAARNRTNYLNQSMRTTVDWNKVRSHALMAGLTYEAYYHIHELAHLVPAEKYFDKNPEYFALIGGKRLKEHTQPCLTNPGLIKLVIARVRQWAESDPDGSIVDVSMNDWANWCECQTCTASYAKYGRNGTHLWFANKIAEAIEKDHPDLLISALTTYSNDRAKPLGGLRPRKNVMIKGGYVEACRYHNFDNCEWNLQRGYVRDLRDWCDITPAGLLLWIYPYGTGPQMRRMEGNYRLLRDLGVKGIYLDDGMSRGPKYLQLYDLEQYLHAKLMWDPNTDAKEIIAEFCQAFYGDAGGEMIKYAEAINDGRSYAKDPFAPKHMKKFPGFHGSTNPPPLNLKAMRDLDKLFQDAEKKVKTDPLRLKRLRQAKLFLQYNLLLYYPQDETMFTKALRDFPVAAKEVGLTTRINNVHLNAGTGQNLDDFVKAMAQPGKGIKKEK